MSAILLHWAAHFKTQSACRGCLIACPYQLQKQRSQEQLGGREMLNSRSAEVPSQTQMRSPEDFSHCFLQRSHCVHLQHANLRELLFLTVLLHHPPLQQPSYWPTLIHVILWALACAVVSRSPKPPLCIKVNEHHREKAALALKSAHFSLTSKSIWALISSFSPVSVQHPPCSDMAVAAEAQGGNRHSHQRDEACSVCSQTAASNVTMSENSTATEKAPCALRDHQEEMAAPDPTAWDPASKMSTATTSWLVLCQLRPCIGHRMAARGSVAFVEVGVSVVSNDLFGWYQSVEELKSQLWSWQTQPNRPRKCQFTEQSTAHAMPRGWLFTPLLLS